MAAMTINNIIAGFGIFTIAGVFYLVKNVFDSERVLSTHPYFKNKVLRLFLALIVVSQLVAILEPQLRGEAFAGFLISLAAGLFQFGQLYEKHIVKVAVSYTGGETIVGAEVYVSIPTDRYVQVAPGTYDRRIAHKDDIHDLTEKAYIDQIKGLDFDKHINVFVQFTEEADFAEHIHLVREGILILKGEIQMYDNKPAYKAGDFEIIPAGKKHYFKASKAGCCIITLEK